MILIVGTAEALRIRQFREAALHEARERSHYIAHITAEAIDTGMWNLDKTQVRDQLLALKYTGNFCGARVLDPQGQLFVDADFPNTPGANQLINSEDVFFDNPTQDPPVSERIGTVEICSSTEALNKSLEEMLYRQAFVALLIIGVVMLTCYFSLQILVQPLVNFSHAMLGLSGTMQPITDPALLKRNEIGVLSTSFNKMVADLSQTYKQLNEAKEKAEKADAAKSNFLANMTHELRTPLNSIIGVTNLLLEHDLGEKEHGMLKLVHQSSHLLLEIVNDVLDVSKVEANEITLERVGFDFEAVVRENMAAIQHAAEGKGILLQSIVDEKLPYLLGDPLRVGQVIRNLLSNAVKYTDQGSITVQTSIVSQRDRSVELRCQVTDTGIGIPKDKLGQMFQKFVQVDASNTRRYGGTGLGLAITKQLVEMMHGKIGLISAPGKGSSFWFSIPFEISEALEDDAKSQRYKERLSSCGTLLPAEAKVLVAEDHPLNQAFIKLLLAKYGFRDVDLFENGKDTLTAITQKSYDLVLMDCFMPEMNGFDTTRQIRLAEQGTNTHLPVIAMTANAMAGDEQACFAVGMDDYIPKPVMEDNFVAVLSRWIRFDSLPKPQTAVAPATTDTSVVNLEILRSFSEGDAAIERQLIDLFLTQSDLNLARLEAALRTADRNEWREAAHTLKGGAAGVGAEALRALCEKAQRLESDSYAERETLLTQIRQTYDAVKTALS